MNDGYDGIGYADPGSKSAFHYHQTPSQDQHNFEGHNDAFRMGDNHGGYPSDGLPIMTPQQHTTEAILNLPIWTWGYEIFSLGVSTVALISLVVLLRSTSDRETPEWSIGRWGVNLNAIVSIVSTLFRTTLLVSVARNISQFGWIWYTHPRPLSDIAYYDAASRGVFGSLALIFRLRVVRLASIGALITVATVALDPFFQQAVTYRTRSAVEDPVAAQTVAVSSWGDGVVALGEISNSYVSLPYDMKIAVRSGLMASELLSIPTVPYSCSTGNCTWDPFNSLAISAECHDKSQYLSLNCSTTTPEICNLVSSGDESFDKMVNNTNQWLPFIIQSRRVDLVPDSAREEFNDVNALLAVVEWAKVNSVGQAEAIKSNDTYEGFRCGVYMSVKEMSAASMNGDYSEVQLNEHKTIANKLNATTDLVNNTWVATFAETYMLSMNATLDFAPPWTAISPSASHNYSIPFNAYFCLVSLLTGDQELLNGNISTATGSGLHGADMPTVLFESTNTTRAMVYMAQYMTNAMRSSATDTLRRGAADPTNSTLVAPSTGVAGAVWTQQQYVVVRWAWLALPAALLVLAVAFLLATFAETHRAGLGLWQTSPLTMLFHARVDSWPAGAHGAPRTSAAMSEVASGMCARIPRGANAVIEVYAKADGAAYPRGNERPMGRDSLEVVG